MTPIQVATLVFFCGCLAVTAQQSETDLARFEKVYQSFQESLQRKDYDSVATVLREYGSSDYFIPMHAYVLVLEMLPHRELARFAEEFITTSISRNSIDGLERFYSGMGNPVKLDGLYLDLFSQRAWARWKLGQVEESWQDMAKVIEYRDAHSAPSEYGRLSLSAVDLLRLGIIATDVGQSDYGWANVSEGILLDAAALDTDPEYKVVLAQIVRKRFGDHSDLSSVIAQLQDTAITPLPPMDLVGLNGQPVEFREIKDKPLVLMFFSPICGSCQQELAAIKPLYEETAGKKVSFILVLNRPDLQTQAERLLQKHGLERATVATVRSGSAYDLIPGEPTTWLVDRQGRIVKRYIGFRQGDEGKYREELSLLYANAP